MSNNSEKVRIIDGKALSLDKYLAKVWDFRQIIFSFTKRDLKVKYAQTVLGLIWTILQPLTGLLIFTLFFDKLIKVDTAGIPYPLFAFIGILAWYFFSYTVSGGGVALSEAGELIKKIYFPKLVLPIVKMMLGFVDFLIGLVLMFILMLFFGIVPQVKMILLPLIIFLNAITGLTIAIWLSALTIRYRDLQHIIPYLINFGIWLTPVFYPSTLIPESFRFLLYMNPMAGIIEFYRWVLLNGPSPNPYYLIGFIPVLILLFTGLRYFRKIEDEIADFI